MRWRISHRIPRSRSPGPGYLLGAIWTLRRGGHPIGGFDLALDSQVPSGAGLSSSAAIESVTALTTSTLSGVDLDVMQIAGLAQQAENDFVGVPCGPMDQTASSAGLKGSVLLFDTRAGTVEHIPFDPAAHGLEVLVIDTRVAALARGRGVRPSARILREGRRHPGCPAGCGTSPSTTCRQRSRGWTTTCCSGGCGTSSPRTIGSSGPSSGYGPTTCRPSVRY